MDVYLLPKKKGRFVLFSKIFQDKSLQPTELQNKERNGSQSPNIEKPQDSQNSEKRISRAQKLWTALKSGYNSVTAKRQRRESLLKEAGKIQVLTLHYPSNLSEAEAREIYNRIVKAQIKKHRRWMIVNGALLPIGVLFTIVPGPNLLLAYLAWRTLAHYQTQKGGKNAIAGPELCFKSENQLYRLDKLINKKFCLNRKYQIQQIGEAMGIGGLTKMYKLY